MSNQSPRLGRHLARMRTVWYYAYTGKNKYEIYSEEDGMDHPVIAITFTEDAAGRIVDVLNLMETMTQAAHNLAVGQLKLGLQKTKP